MADGPETDLDPAAAPKSLPAAAEGRDEAAAPAAPPSRDPNPAEPESEDQLDAPPERRRLRKWVLGLAKATTSAVLLAWILTRTDLGAIRGALSAADGALLFAAFALYAATYYVRAHRWRLLLEPHGVRPPLRFLLNSYLISVFFSNFLPTIIGGDAYRMYDSWKAGTSKVSAMAVILVDRVLGLVILVAFAVGALLVTLATGNALSAVLLWVGLAAAALAGFVWWVFAAPRGWSGRGRLALPAPAALRRAAASVQESFSVYRGRTRTLGRALWLSLLFQTAIIVHYYLIARALGFPTPFLDFFLIIPLAIFIMMLPISINAIGLREHTFVFFLAAYGVTAAEAVAFAWVAYGVVLVLGLIGGLLYAIRPARARMDSG